MADVQMRILLSAVGGAGVIGTVGQVASALGKGGLSGTLATIGVAAAGVAIGIGVTAVKMAGDFQSATETLVTGAGEQQSALDGVRQGLLKMAVDTGTSTQQLTDGMFMVESAGYRGAQGLRVMQVAAEGARVQNADLGTVAYALTGILHDYHMSAGDASSAMNGLIASVQNGKMHLQDLANSMGAVLPTASALHVSFPQVAAAVAEMTNSNTTARQAAQNLAHAMLALSAPNSTATKSMKEVGLTAQQVKNALANQGLPAALQMIEDHVGKKFPANSVEYTTAMKNILGGVVGYKVALALSGPNLKEYENNIKNISGAMNKGKGSVNGWTDVQNTFNFKMDQAKQALNGLMINIGTKLLPILSNIVSGIMPIVSAFTTWIGTGDNLKIVIGAVGGIILGLLVPALWSMTAALLANPITWIVLGIAALAAGLVALYTHVAPVRQAVDAFFGGLKQFAGFIAANFMPAMHAIGTFLQTYVLPILQQIGSFVVSQFKPVWQSLVQLWNGQLMPLFKQLWAALQQLMPLFKIIGAIVLGVVVVAFVTLMGIIHGVIAAVTTIISDIGSAIGGVVQIITGIVQVIAGIFNFIKDLLTGNWKNLGNDLKGIWQGIVNVFGGIFQTMGSILHAIFGGIGSFISGFVQGIGNTITTMLGMADKAKIEAEQKQAEMKLNSINNALQTAKGVLMHADAQRQGILKELEKTKDPKKRHELEMELSAITKKEEEAKKTIEKEKEKKEGVLKHLAELKAQAEEANKNIFQKAADWFGQTKDKAIQLFGNLKDGIGQKLTDLKNMVGGWFSNFGSFWHDRWNDITKSVGNIFSGISGFLRNALNGGIDIINSWIRGIDSIGFDAGPIHFHPSIPLIPHLATGGTISTGGFAVVGERGPELAYLPTGTTVFPNGTGPAAAAGAGGPVYNFYIAVSTMARSQSEVNNLVNMIEQELGRRFRTQTPGYSVFSGAL